MRILCSGDWHGSLDHARRVMDLAHRHEIPQIIQVGDFGWWPHIQDGEHSAYAGRVNDFAQKRGIDVAWLDGNHENFDDLESRPFDLDARGFRHYQRPNSATGKVLTHVAYIPRGTVFNLDNGRSAMAFGGAASVDKQMRTPGHSWWRQELPTMREVNEALDNARPVDYMFTHDAPALPPALPHGWKEDPASVNNRQGIHVLMNHYQPSLLFHGHYHLPYTAQIGNTTVYGLGADRNMYGGSQGNNVILDTKSGSVVPAELMQSNEDPYTLGRWEAAEPVEVTLEDLGIELEDG